MSVRFTKTMLLYILLIVQVIQITYYLHSNLLYSTNIQCTPEHPTAVHNISDETEAPFMLGNSSLWSGLRSHIKKKYSGLQLPWSSPTVFVVTPTYRRPTQMADLTRLSQTLMNLDFIFWLVVEDGETTQLPVAQLLQRSGLPHRYMAAATPARYRNDPDVGRGVFNRRAALDWLRAHEKRGVLYFADDDNSYDIRLFQQIRSTQKVSVFPVGMILEYGISSPIVRQHKVVGFHDAFQALRKFAVDMAGFAVNLEFLYRKPNATIPLLVSYLEDGFLRALGTSLDDLEPLAHDCTEVLVWHTRTQTPFSPNVAHLPPHSNDTNLPALYANILA
ncbi:galactosylgalactosylxylosylprotein 3-beta-glucuronosyltransferase S [Hyalella azteca]|uniref:Galactosylgalactosylxylosylprotein 3-beta-glucuronosyltransferase n=1 Tax=Hyalella azteca TaxID=294128 RepID=A0A8B7NUM1_HYAAZ|nr:galactosylgalactosylxylosylprotein 3-beta-glucuronosyltransferase S [Hyalella azteca]